jgi:hypothetical protein
MLIIFLHEIDHTEPEECKITAGLSVSCSGVKIGAKGSTLADSTPLSPQSGNRLSGTNPRW